MYFCRSVGENMWNVIIDLEGLLFNESKEYLECAFKYFQCRYKAVQHELHLYPYTNERAHTRSNEPKNAAPRTQFHTHIRTDTLVFKISHFTKQIIIT